MANSYFTDPRDGETYRTVKIGNRIWFAENLRHKCEELRRHKIAFLGKIRQ